MGLVQTPARGKSCDVRKPASGSLTSFFFKNKQTIYLFLAVLGLHCRLGSSLLVESRGYSLVAVRGLLTVGACLVSEDRLCGLR